MAQTSIEVQRVDAGNVYWKVRVNVSSHSVEEARRVEQAIMNLLADGYALSDYESELEPGDIVYAAPDSEVMLDAHLEAFYEDSQGLDEPPGFDMQYDAWDEPRDVREGWEA